MRGGDSRGGYCTVSVTEGHCTARLRPVFGLSAACYCAVPWFGWIDARAGSGPSGRARRGLSAGPARRTRDVRAARRRGGHGRLPVLPAGLLPLRGALLERAPPRRGGPPRGRPDTRYPHRDGTGRGLRGRAGRARLGRGCRQQPLGRRSRS